MNLAANSVIAGRFLIERLAESGGMGHVFRARDLRSGEPVALKILHEMGDAPHQVDRFLREAALLAELRHPGIVSYLAHGCTESGQSFLTMEWLEGETLAKRLDRGRLEPRDAITLVRRTAEALAVAHARGIVHRDLKPQNLLLRDGDPDRVLLLDFGIARRVAHTQGLTRTGMVLGTPGYMAPEQVRGERDVGPSADVFALGCVLFECLTGEPLFLGESVMAVLARILLDEPRSLREVRPDMPPAFDALLARMVAKEPKDRLRDAAALLDEIAAMAALAASSTAEMSAPSTERATPWLLVAKEQSVFSVVLAASPASLKTQETLILSDAEERAARAEFARAALARLGMRIEQMMDGSIVATQPERRRTTAKEQAALAAQCALLLHEHLPDALISVATGRGTLHGGMPVGEALDRATRLHGARLAEGTPALGDPASRVLLDDVTAGLLDGRFRVERLGTGVFALQAAEAGADESRLLLGKPTPCVGRERELAMLDLLLAGCIEEPSACAVVVTAPPGIGKSRLRHEFLRRLASSGQEATILLGRGDPMSAGSSRGLLEQALRGLFGVTDAIEPAAQRARVTERVARRIPGEAGQEVASFLSELCKIHVPDEDDQSLRSARQDPFMLNEQISRAFLAFLRAECESAPVLVVLEDLHWGDALTVRLLDAALRELENRPLMVLALARPEVREHFPGLWENRRRQEIELGALNKRACEILVKQVLGPGVEPRDINRIINQSAGNALFLEELIRAVVEDERGELPRTVLAMLQSRLLRLEPGARRALCAASVFGETFWRGGVLSLLGSGETGEGVDRSLAALVLAELIETCRTSRLAGEIEYRFRHALMRDAAYALMTADDQALGHGRAGAYLERAGERDPLILAEHYERGRELARAGHFYALAAMEAHCACDGAAEEALAKRGLACDVPDDVRERLLTWLTESHGWRGQWVTGAQYADQVIQMSTTDSLTWFMVIPTRVMASVLGGTIAEIIPVLDRLCAIEPTPENVDSLAFAMIGGSINLSVGGRIDLAERLYGRLLEAIEPVAEQSPLARAWVHMGRAWWCASIEGDYGASLRSCGIGLSSFEEAGHRRGKLLSLLWSGISRTFLGTRAEAERELRATHAAGDEFGPIHAFRVLSLITILLDRGALIEARREAEGFLASRVGWELAHDEALARVALAQVLCREGDLAGAEVEARRAVAITERLPLDQLLALSTLASILLEAGRPGDARATAALAVEKHEALRIRGMRTSFARLLLAQSLEASGDHEGARAVLGAARARLLEQAARLDGEEARRSFLFGVPENARTMELAAAYLDATAQ